MNSPEDVHWPSEPPSIIDRSTFHTKSKPETGGQLDLSSSQPGPLGLDATDRTTPDQRRLQPRTSLASQTPTPSRVRPVATPEANTDPDHDNSRSTDPNTTSAKRSTHQPHHTAHSPTTQPRRPPAIAVTVPTRWRVTDPLMSSSGKTTSSRSDRPVGSADRPCCGTVDF
jgi:hypothetical protein